RDAPRRPCPEVVPLPGEALHGRGIDGGEVGAGDEPVDRVVVELVGGAVAHGLPVRYRSTTGRSRSRASCRFFRTAGSLQASTAAISRVSIRSYACSTRTSRW